MRSRGPLAPLIVVASLLVLIGGGVAGAVVLLDGGGNPLAAVPSPSASPSPSPVLVAPSDAAVPTNTGVAEALRPLLADRTLGGAVGVSVVDLATGQPLYTHAADLPAVPASVTKLATAAAVLAALGPVHRFTTRVVAGPSPGDVVLVGGGDPTLTADPRTSYLGLTRLDLLAAQVRQAAGGQVTRVLVDATRYTGPAVSPDWEADVVGDGFVAPIAPLMLDGGRLRKSKYAQRSGSPDLAAGRALAKLLGAPVGTVARSAATPDARELGRADSPPLVRLVELMLTESDNVLAETLAREVAIARQQPATFHGGGAAIREALAGLGVPMAATQILDGSGLSHGNKLTPASVTSLLALAAGTGRPELRPVFSGLPVAAYSGTLLERYAGTAKPGAGLVRAKTGSLDRVASLAGIVLDVDGRLLGFALFANRVPAGGGRAAAQALDRIAVRLVACGCR